MNPTQVVRWLGVADKKALCEQAVQRICTAAAEAIKLRGQFVVVLAGGSTPRAVYKLLCNAHTDWSRWQVFFSDERCLAVDDCGRNSRMASEAWLRHVAIPASQLHVIPAELGAHQAAVAYTHVLRHIGEFDLVLLGLGEDGHTASLFPSPHGISAISGPDAVAIFDAPKPPARRVSLSAARLSRTRAALFLVAGERKRHVVSQWQAAAPLVATSICPAVGVDVLVETGLLAHGNQPELRRAAVSP